MTKEEIREDVIKIIKAHSGGEMTIEGLCSANDEIIGLISACDKFTEFNVDDIKMYFYELLMDIADIYMEYFYEDDVVKHDTPKFPF